MTQPGRDFSNVKYRFGFNGKENDNEVSGEGNQQDYGMRISDPRLGRFLSVDPITKDYPELTPYQFASNTPIQAIDLDGLEAAGATNIEGEAYREINGSSDIRRPDGGNTVVRGTAVQSNGRSFRYVPSDGMYEEMPRARFSNPNQTTNSRNANTPGEVTAAPSSNSGTTAIRVENSSTTSTRSEVDRGYTKANATTSTHTNSTNNVRYQRTKAVEKAWKAERSLVEKTGEGSRRWTESEKKELLSSGKVKGYKSHHVNSVKNYSEEAGNPANVKFVTQKEHLKEHGGNFKNQTSGKMINRETPDN